MENLEIWKDIKWYEWKYMVSNFWNVISLNFRRSWKSKLLSPWTNSQWYKIVILTSNAIRKNLKVHRLVAIAFIENPFNKKAVNHINWIKADNNIKNLEFVTYSENTLHAYRIGLKKVNENNHFFTNNPSKWKFWAQKKNAKSILQYNKDWIFIREFSAIMDANRELWLSHWVISNCCTWRSKNAGGFIWKYKHLNK